MKSFGVRFEKPHHFQEMSGRFLAIQESPFDADANRHPPKPRPAAGAGILVAKSLAGQTADRMGVLPEKA